MGTASSNVTILDENFYLPSLTRNRRVWAYLPTGYSESEARYPVIYMHDGQNLFDEVNAFGSEWQVDETLDAFQGKVIIIGIDNGNEHRMAEYMWHDHPEHGAAEGQAYLLDIIQAIKPTIDQTLRTLPDREHTGIAGSSMGGLISLYAGLYFPEVFGVIGVFSPALWVHAPGVFTETNERLSETCNNAGGNVLQRWYFYAGALESETMVGEVAAMVKIFRMFSCIETTYQLDATGIHDEQVWKNYFPDFYKWYAGEKPGALLEQQSEIKVDDVIKE